MACLVLRQEASSVSRTTVCRSVASPFFLPFYRADPARHNGTKTVPGTHLELFGPQQGQRWKRTRGNGNRPAVRPPGPEKWSHRLGHPT